MSEPAYARFAIRMHSAQIHAGQAAHNSTGRGAIPGRRSAIGGDGERFSTMTEVGTSSGRPTRRRVERRAVLQGIAGTRAVSPLNLDPEDRQRNDGSSSRNLPTHHQGGYKLPIDERILATRIRVVFGLDHILSNRRRSREMAAIREWLKRDGSCLLLAPIMTSVSPMR